MHYSYVVQYKYTTDAKPAYFKTDYVKCFLSLNQEFDGPEDISAISVIRTNTKTNSKKCIFEVKL